MFPWGNGFTQIPVIFLVLVIISLTGVAFAETEEAYDEFNNSIVTLSSSTSVELAPISIDDDDNDDDGIKYDDDAGDDGDENDNDEVTICHYPLGNPENLQTIIISPNALDAHLQHDDIFGECYIDEPELEVEPEVELEIEPEIEPDLELESDPETEVELEPEPEVEPEVELESTDPESIVIVGEIVVNFGCINYVDASNAIDSNIIISIDCVVSNGESLPELEPEPEFFVFTDKSSYIAREFVQIFGFIKNVDELNLVNVKVINPNEYVVLDTTILPESDGSFSTSLHTMFELAWYPDGEYQVIATSGVLETETSFSFRMNSQVIPPQAPTLPLPTALDSIPPVIVTPSDIVVDATSSSGSVIGFSVSANDDTDGRVDVTCSPEPGTIFTIGTTTVICSALDNARNLATETFTITVENKQNTNLISFNTPPISFVNLQLDSTILSDDSNYIEADTQLPSWVKQNAKWWSEGIVSDLPLANGIQFMMKNDIIPMPQNLDRGDNFETNIPDWLKNNAEWWADGMISEADFINCINFLCGKGIIRV